MRRTPTPCCLAAAALVALAGCSEDLEPATPDAAPPGPDGAVGPTHVVTDENADGTFTTHVDASSMADWVGFDFQTRAEAALGGAGWDLGFLRYEVELNGGVTGAGGAEVAILPGADFAALTRAPADGYLTDSEAALAFATGDGWYSYDPATHVLTPRDVVFVVRSVEGDYFKLRFDGYYDAAGTSGHPSFTWGAVAAPAPPAALTVDASDASAYVYVSVAAGVVAVADPTASSGWDLAFSRTLVRTNGGTSGAGAGGARLAAAGTGYATLSAATPLGFVADAELPVPGPPGSGTYSGNPALAGWYDYDPTTHVVSPKDVVFVVRTATGGHAKLQITGWADGVYTLRLAPIARDLAVQHASLAATDAAAPLYFSLRRGEVLSDADVVAGSAWDLRLARTLVATNSGTSGPGLGGAADPDAAALADVTSAAGASYTVDAELPVPGPPGSGTYSGNAVLGAWYDYDATTHAVTPKAKAFLVRTADGGHAKLAITSWSDGTYGVDWVYAGAGRDDFAP